MNGMVLVLPCQGRRPCATCCVRYETCSLLLILALFATVVVLSTAEPDHFDNVRRKESTKQRRNREAGLSCMKYGGPSDAASAEMVYWRDIPTDDDFVSPFRNYGPKRKYLTFEPDEAGWNNMRMGMETYISMALAMGRTLVIPPNRIISHLEKGDSNKLETFGMGDFFHLEQIASKHPSIEFITTQEYLEKEIVTGNIRNADTGEMLTLPNNRTNWDGIGGYLSDDSKSLARVLQSAGVSPKWKDSDCLATFPGHPGPGRSSKLTKMLEDIIDEGHAEIRDYQFRSNPTDVNATAKDRMRELLSPFRSELCMYEDSLQNAKVLHFEGGGEYRLLSHFYAFLFFEDWHLDLLIKRFIRDHVRYVDKIQCAAARVISAVRDKARQHGNIEGSFDSLHVRRGDFQLQFIETEMSAVEIRQVVQNKFVENATVYIATDEKNKSFFDPFLQSYHVYYLDDFLAEVGDVDTNFYGMIDQLISSRGSTFFGTYFSTFSGYVTRLRGYHSQRISKRAFKTGESPSYYFAPDLYMDVLQTYTSLHERSWAREFPICWRDIDRQF